jgi:PAS domain S-box-containing protein
MTAASLAGSEHSSHNKRWLPPLWVGLLLILAPSLLFIAIVTYQLVSNLPALRQGQRVVDHTIEVITTADALKQQMQRAENNQRGFLITGNPAYLDPYKAALHAASGLVMKLKQLTADNAEQQRRWPILERQIDIKSDEMRRTIEARRDEGLDTARRIVESHLGAEAMRAIEQIIDAAIAAENDLLRNRQEMLAETGRVALINSLISAIVALLAIAAGVVLVWLGFRGVARSERELGESEERFRGLLESAPDAMVIVDQGGTITLINAGTETVFGYSREELIGRPVEMLVPSQFRDRHVNHRAEFLADPRARFMGTGLELRGRRKDGSEFPVEVSLSPHQAAEGLVILSAIRDITERKEAEAELAREREERERAEETLRQAQKMEVLGQLSGGIAHDFNNMLGVIIGSLEILQQRLPSDDPKLRSPIETAIQAADRSAVLTHRLLAFSRQQPLEPRPFDINRLVSGMSGLLNRMLGENIAIETVLAAGAWTVSADVNQLENALLNLAVNARDAMPQGGKLTIETANVYLDEAYAGAHSEVSPGQYVMLAVTDTGVGMDQETIEKSFDPFFTTKGPGHGTGLGLSQVYGFVKQSGGHIKIYSEVGQGTTVKLYLPREAVSGTHTAEERVVQPPTAEQRSGTILVVEDNELLLVSVATMLRDQGYRVLTATDAEAALQLLEAEPDIRLLFTDVVLPSGVNGRQLAEEARRRRPTLVVLFTTGYTRNAIIHQGRLDRGVELITKPFTYAALLTKIQQVLANQQVLAK